VLPARSTTAAPVAFFWRRGDARLAPFGRGVADGKRVEAIDRLNPYA
jgi:hypothetical protein